MLVVQCASVPQTAVCHQKFGAAVLACRLAHNGTSTRCSFTAADSRAGHATSLPPHSLTTLMRHPHRSRKSGCTATSAWRRASSHPFCRPSAATTRSASLGARSVAATSPRKSATVRNEAGRCVSRKKRASQSRAHSGWQGSRWQHNALGSPPLRLQRRHGQQAQVRFKSRLVAAASHQSATVGREQQAHTRFGQSSLWRPPALGSQQPNCLCASPPSRTCLDAAGWDVQLQARQHLARLRG